MSINICNIRSVLHFRVLTHSDKLGVEHPNRGPMLCEAHCDAQRFYSYGVLKHNWIVWPPLAIEEEGG